MSAKREVAPRRKKMLKIAEKVQLLDMLKEGKSFAAVGRYYGIDGLGHEDWFLVFVSIV